MLVTDADSNWKRRETEIKRFILFSFVSFRHLKEILLLWCVWCTDGEAVCLITDTVM